MISLQGIEKIFKQGNTVIQKLKGITLNIEQGEIFGIIGEKDAGKSSLIRCINLLESPSRGAVIIDSCDLTALSTDDLRKIRRRIGMIFQHFNLLNSRSVFDNIALPLEFIGTPREKIEEIVFPLLELTELVSVADVYPEKLNNELKQRVAIARALVSQPTILLCEEATAALDPKAQASILQLLRMINKKLNLTIVLITHELEVIKSICDKCAVLQEGEIVEQGTAFELYCHPKSYAGKEFVKKAAYADMPTALRNRLSLTYQENKNPVLRISFRDISAQSSFIPTIMQQFTLSINIIQAHAESLQNHFLGIMIAEMIGEKEEIDRAIQYLEHRNLHIEVLGYATRTS